MAGTFRARMEELIAEVGHGPLEAICDVDQVYAQYQETHGDFNHPHGGVPHALETSLFSTYDESYREMADETLRGGLKLAAAMAAERIAERYAEIAPVELYNLRESGHPQALDDGDKFYDREPEQHRLSDEEIATLDAARNALNPNHLYGSYYDRQHYGPHNPRGRRG